MNPAKDKRRRLFEAFHNKQNISNNSNIAHGKSVCSTYSLRSPSISSIISPSSEVYQDQIFKLRTQLLAMKEQYSNSKKKTEYFQKMECFYLSQLASFRERQERSQKKIQILLQELPSQKQKCAKQHSSRCEQSCQFQEQSLCLRKEIELKNKIIEQLQSQLHYKSIQSQAIRRHQQSLWREEDEDMESNFIKISEL